MCRLPAQSLSLALALAATVTNTGDWQRNSQRQRRHSLLKTEWRSQRSRNHGLLLLLLCCVSVHRLHEVHAASDSTLAANRNAYHSYQHPSCTIYVAMLALRGGDESDDKESDASEQHESPSSKLWLVRNLFRLNDDVKSQASLSNDDDTNDTLLITKTRPHNNSRGGALAIVRTKPRRFQWLAPLDTSKVAPLSSRLLKDDDDDEQYEAVEQATDTYTDSTTKDEAINVTETATTTATEPTVSSSLNQLWWGNVWEQQILDTDTEEKQVQQDEEPFQDTGFTKNATATIAESPRKSKGNENGNNAPVRERKHSSERKRSKRKVPKDRATSDTTQQSGKRQSSPENSPSLQNATTEATTRILEEASEELLQIVDDAADPPLLDLPSSMRHHTERTTAASKESSDPSPFVSSGYWASIDRMISLGYAESHPAWRVSRRLRSVRKTAARVTGLHGALSGKHQTLKAKNQTLHSAYADAQMGSVRRRLAAIHRARTNAGVSEPDALSTSQSQGATRRGFWGRSDVEAEFSFVLEKSRKEELEEQQRKERVRVIDRKIMDAQKRLQDLACEKDVLQRRPNPLWNYTALSTKRRKAPAVPDETETAASAAAATPSLDASRRFNFPPKDLVEDYLDVLFVSNRLVKLNHTDLWKNGGGLDTDEDYLDDDELAFSSDVDGDANRKRRNGNSKSGNWFLRHGLGEKIGEATETAAYKAVCTGVMGVLARSLSAIHGVNIMTHSDIRLFMEHAPDLPPLAAGIIPGISGMTSNYAHEALHDAMRKGARKHKKRRSRSSTPGDAFLQRDAVVETLLSHCQISAPLLRLFPLAWQRAMLGNIITLVTAVISDFFDGLEFQILGHQLSFSFTPITEDDMIRHLGMVGDGFNRHRPKPEEFEAAVRATAEDMSENLRFLDRWHERAMGSDMLRMQIATLISRLVLTLIDDVLGGARMDLWAAHAGGPRLVAGLEHRTASHYMDADGLS